MKIENFIKDFCDQFDGAVNLTPMTNFRDLEDWSSLTALNVLMMIDESYGVALNPDDMRKTKTVQELFDLVQSKL